MKDKNLKPPRFAAWLLYRFSLEKDRDSMLDDLEFEYRELESERSRHYANLWYLSHFFRALPELLSGLIYWRFTMFKNYVKIALRNIRKQKGYSLINIAGLVIGLTCFFLIILYVQYELSFDSFHKNKNRIYRVIHRGETLYRGSNSFAISPGPLAKAMMNDLPEVQYATRAYGLRNRLLTFNDKKFYENGIIADENFLNIFSFKLLRGDKSGFSEPHTIYLTEKLAEKYFGSEDPMNKVIDCKHNEEDYQLIVKGIIEDVPHNSHIRFDFIVSLETWMSYPEKKNRYTWSSNYNFTYVLIKENIDYQTVESKLGWLIEKHSGRVNRNQNGWLLEPLSSIHLHTNDNFDWAVRSDIKYLYIFSAIGAAILLIACINYMNLATAHSTKRARETGIRKVSGALRSQLIRQFLSETVILSVVSAFISVAAVRLLLPVINGITGLPITLNLLSTGYILPGILLLVFFIGIISGSYPALLLSSFKPVKVLKSGRFSSSKGVNLRNFLVVFQFCMAVIFIVGTAVIYKQLLFIKNTDFGYKKDHIVVINSLDENVISSYDVIKSELMQNPAITGVTRCNRPPMSTASFTFINLENAEGEIEGRSTYYFSVGFDYLNVFGLVVVEGRDFPLEAATGKAEGRFIVNEEFVKWMNWENPIGKRVDMRFGPDNAGCVIGVVKNFNYLTLYERIEPAVIWLRHSDVLDTFAGTIAVGIRPENISGTYSFINETIENFTEKLPANVSFMDDMFYAKYKTEQMLAKIITAFASIAVFIACLGLFGLASFTAEKRTKEIGIRKTLGASIPGIFILLTRGFIKWIVLANLIAWPLAYYFMNKWLQNFAYRTDISIWIFVISGLTALAIALLTVSYQSIKAARANPVDSLRYE